MRVLAHPIRSIPIGGDAWPAATAGMYDSYGLSTVAHRNRRGNPDHNKAAFAFKRRRIEPSTALPVRMGLPRNRRPEKGSAAEYVSVFKNQASCLVRMQFRASTVTRHEFLSRSHKI